MPKNESLDFSNVSLANVQQNPNVVYELGDGVIPKMAQEFGFELDDRANPDNMGKLIGVVGPKATLRDNKTILKDAIPTAAGWVEDSAIMKPVDGGLWTPDIPTPQDASLVLMGGVPNWIRRSTERAINSPQTDVVIAAGGRVMESGSDLANSDVKEFIADNDRSPTEAEFFDRYHRESLEAAGKSVTLFSSEAAGSADILSELFAQHPELLEQKLAAVRVANAARTMALQLRLAAKTAHAGFDGQDAPQMFAISDKIALAKTPEQAANPAEFQSPVTALRQIPVLAKELLSQQVK